MPRVICPYCDSWALLEGDLGCANCRGEGYVIDKEEYANVIRAAYALCQQIHDMELAGAVTYANTRLHSLAKTHYRPADLIGLEVEEELGLLYALLQAKNSFPKTFLEGCKNATTPQEIKFRTQYPGTLI